MVLGLLTLTAIPTVIGTSEAVSEQKKQNAAAKRSAKFNLSAIFEADGLVEEEAYVVLKGGRLYIDRLEKPVGGHKFCGYFFKYPSPEQFEGLVSTISDDPPMLNWIFVDSDTMALRHGSRNETLGQIVGPWDWTEDEKDLLLEDDEGFVAVEEDDAWALYFDRSGDLSLLPQGRRAINITLRRKLLLGIESKLTRT